ncbi:MAG: amidohydrolase family protein, partial [Victivallaceae bacterium]
MNGILFQNVTYLDVASKELRQGDIEVTDGKISGIGDFTHTQYAEVVDLANQGILVPGFIDAHLHFESSMVLPAVMISEALKRGTVTYIADPHEAANVAGLDGIQLLLDATERIPGNIYFMLPSCVPALPDGENGATLDAVALGKYVNYERILGLGEVMDVPSVVNGNPEIMEKLELFKNRIKDGHAPLLTGELLQKYVACGINNDHECTTADEVVEKVNAGMHIHAREGSAAHNLQEIMTAALKNHLPWESFSFCSDDRSISDIRQTGYIDHAIRLAVKCGVPALEAILIASFYTARHYKIDHIT